MTTVWIVLSSKPSTLTISVNSLNKTHVPLSSNAISPSFGRDVINVIQWSQRQDVRHVTMVVRVMGMEVVFHVHLMNVVLRIHHSLKERTVCHGRNVSQNAWSVHQGIILMIQVVHVWNVMNTHVVQETLTIQLIWVVLNVQLVIMDINSRMGHVFHVHLMNVVLRIPHILISIVYHGRNVSQNV